MSHTPLKFGYRVLHYLALVGILFHFIVYPAYAMVEYFPYGVRSNLYIPFVRPDAYTEKQGKESTVSNQLAVKADKNTRSESGDALLASPKKSRAYHTDEHIEIYSSDVSGVIGYSNQSGSDDPSDNIFGFIIDKTQLADKNLTLSYEVYGIENASGVARSINEHTATGGYFVQKNAAWKTVEEPVSIKQLKQGANHILFTTFENQQLDYKVKNVKLTATPDPHVQPVHLTDQQTLYVKNNKAYVKGIVLEANTQLFLNGTKVVVNNNEFEAVLENATALDAIEVALKKNDGTVLYTENVKITSRIEVSEVVHYKAPQTNVAIEQKNAGSYGFSLSGVDLTISTADYKNVDQITVQKLRPIDMAPVGTNVINVTASKAGYRFLPEGAQFVNKVPLTLAFDKALLPKGYTEHDVKILYFDLKKRNWVAVETDTIMADQSMITGLTDHFTDYIAGVIQAPESPETNSYTPTSISDIQVANPTQNIVQIQPPTANQKGDGTLDFPITIPAGRNGLQPNLSVSYNNNGSSGIVGYGWDIAVPYISVDTKFGVPKYDSSYETESYLLNGEDLVMQNGNELFQPHRTGSNLARQTGGVFFPKVERSFSKIQRLGTSPDTYSWIVTDKSGTKYYYGQSSLSILKALNGGNIAKWYLDKVEDKNGNYIRYTYETKPYYTQDNLNEGVEMRLNNIIYTRNSNFEQAYNSGQYAFYQVRFHYRNDKRSDANFNYRYGFKEVNASWLDYINVVSTRSDGDLPGPKHISDFETNYRFTYENGSFGKSLLKSIITENIKTVSDLTPAGTEIYTHTFDYHNDIQGGLFASPKKIELKDDFAADKHSALSSTIEEFSSSEVNVGAGISPSSNPPSWWPFSYGGTINFSFPSSVSTSSSPTVLLLDIDGDGLDDKVIKIGNEIKYHKNLGGIAFSTQLYKVHHLNNLGWSESKTKNNPAMSLSLIAGNYSASKSQTNGRARGYFADVNNDGLIDYVHDRIVYFNRIDPNSDLPTFTDNSALTPNLIFKEGDVDPEISDPLPDFSVGNDLMDAVKVWVAPKKGDVKIFGTITKGFVASHNGVRFSIEHNGGPTNRLPVWDPGFPIKGVDPKIPMIPWDPDFVPISVPFPVNNYTKEYIVEPKLLVTNSMDASGSAQVEAGDHIYFRVNSSQLPTDLVDVDWDMSVEYDDGTDGSSFQQSMLFGDVAGEPMTISKTGTYRVLFPDIQSLYLNDDVDIVVKAYRIDKSAGNEGKHLAVQGGSETIYSGRLKAASGYLDYPSTAIALNVTSGIDELNPDTFVYVEVVAAAKFGIDWKAFDNAFIPTLKNMATSENKHIVPRYEGRNNAVVSYPPIKLPFPFPVKIKHNFTLSACNQLDDECPNQYIYMQARYEDGQILEVPGVGPAKFRYRLDPSGMVNEVKQFNGDAYESEVNSPDSDINVEPDRNLILEYTTDEYAVASALNHYQNNNQDLVSSNMIGFMASPAAGMSGPVALNTPPPGIRANIATKTAFELGLGLLYKNWGQFAYKGAAPDEDFTPIEQSYVSRLAISGVSSFKNPSANEKQQMQNLMGQNPELINYNFNEEKFNFLTTNVGINQNQIQAIKHFTMLRSDRALNAWSSHERLYVKELEMSPYLRYNNENENQMLPVSPPVNIGPYGATAIVKESTSESKSKGYGIGFYGLNLGTTNSEAKSIQLNDYMDMNGDGYPDVIGKKIQFTSYRGGLSNTFLDRNFVTTTNSNGSGRSAGGSSAHIVSLADPAGRFTRVKVGDNTSFSGNIGGGAESYITNTLAEQVFVDINGDGLADVIKPGNTVEFNTANSFVPSTWGGYTVPSKSVTTSHSMSASVGAGFTNFTEYFPALDFDAISNSNFDLSVGTSGSRGTTHSKNDFVDFNGDGLPDYISDNSIYFNTGTAHTASGMNLPRLAESSSSSRGTTINASFLIAIQLGTLPFVIKVGGGGGKSSGKSYNEENVSLRDFDGDGYVDIVESPAENILNVRLSKIGRTNMLKAVHNPTGSTIELDYGTNNPVSGKGIGSTYSMPFKKWVLTRVKVHDGFSGDGIDEQKYAFEYEHGLKDRRERKFLGFGKVKTIQLKSDGSIYRSKEQYYWLNEMTLSEVYSSGNSSTSRKWQYIGELPYVEFTMDGVGRLLNKTEHEYALYSIGASTTYGPYQTDSAPAVTYTDVSRIVPLLKRSINTVYHFQGNSWWNPLEYQTSQLFKQYDKYGNLTSYVDDPTRDNNQVLISYHELNPSTQYVVNVPASHSVNSDRYSTTTIDSKGNVAQINRHKNGTPGGAIATTDMEYDLWGNLTKVTKPQPDANNTNRMYFSYTYDPLFMQFVAQVNDAYGYRSQTAYSHFGLPTMQKDLNEIEFHYGYDPTRRTVLFKGPYNTDWTIRHEYKKQTNGLYYAVTKHNIMDEVLTPGEQILHTSSFADGLGRIVQTKKQLDPEPGCTGYRLATSGLQVYDAFGRVVESYLGQEEKNCGANFFDGLENYTALPHIDQEKTTAVYDVLDRVMQNHVYGLNATTTYAYGFEHDEDGNRRYFEQITLPQGNRSATYKDEKGRVTAIRQFDGVTALRTKYRYDHLSQLTGVTDADNKLTEYEYDHFGQKTKTTHPDNGISEFTYDLTGKLAESKNQNLLSQNKSITYHYNFDQLTSIVYPSYTANGINYVGHTVSYTYGTSTAPDYAVGRLTGITDLTGTKTMKYGYLGEVVEDNRILNSQSSGQLYFKTKFRYDSWGRIMDLTYPDGEKVLYQYNSVGQLTRMANVLGEEYLKEVQYNFFDQPTRIQYGNEVVTTNEYDITQRIRAMKLDRPDATTFMNNVYTYDKNQNITGISNTFSQHGVLQLGGISNKEYTYDQFNRLSSASGTWSGGVSESHNYTLNMVYNNTHGILEKKQLHNVQSPAFTGQSKNSYESAYKYDNAAHPHAVSGINYAGIGGSSSAVSNFTYDANGNMTHYNTNFGSFSNRDMIWDQQNRLLAVIDDATNVSHYVYDHAGERTFKATGTVATVSIGGADIYSVLDFNNYTIYPSGYMVVDPGKNEYSKHYYIGSKRFVSRIEGQTGQFTAPMAKGTGASQQYSGTEMQSNAMDFTQTLGVQNTTYGIAIGNDSQNCLDQLNAILTALGNQNTPTSSVQHCIDKINGYIAQYTICDALVEANKYICIPKNTTDPGNTPDDTTPPTYTPGEMQQADCMTALNIVIAMYTAQIQTSEAQTFLQWYQCVQGCIAKNNITDSYGCWERFLISGVWPTECNSLYAVCSCVNQPTLNERERCPVLALIYIDQMLRADLSNACAVYTYVTTKYNCVPENAPYQPDPPKPGDTDDNWTDGGGNTNNPDDNYDETKRKPIWWYHTDHLGSSTYLTDNFGRPSHYYETLPFGEMMVEHNQSTYNGGQYNNAYKFNGKELDETTGMYYYGARYYDPRISIFVSVDPLAEKTMTPYQYVNNNPINLIDPTGMSAEGSGNGGGILSRVWSGIKSTFSSSNESSPIEDTLLDEMVINTTSKRGDKVFNLKISGRDRSVYENDKGIISGGYRLAKQFRNWSDKMLSGGFHFEDDDNKPKGDQSLRKKSFGSRPQAANAAGFVQGSSFAKGGEGIKYDIEDVKTGVNLFNNFYSGLNNGNGLPDAKVELNRNFTYDVFYDGSAAINYIKTSTGRSSLENIVVPVSRLNRTMDSLNRMNKSNDSRFGKSGSNK